MEVIVGKPFVCLRQGNRMDRLFTWKPRSPNPLSRCSANKLRAGSFQRVTMPQHRLLSNPCSTRRFHIQASGFRSRNCAGKPQPERLMGVQPKARRAWDHVGTPCRALKERGRTCAGFPALFQSARLTAGKPRVCVASPLQPWAEFLEAFSLRHIGPIYFLT